MEQYRFGLDYLKEKYPSFNFDIIDCNPETKSDPYATFYFVEQDSVSSSEIIYTLRVSGESDDFYVNFVSEPFAPYVKNSIQDISADIKGVGVLIECTNLC